jgi:hypothetical protein
MAEKDEYQAEEDAKAKKTAADKAAKEAAEPQLPVPSQEEADAIKEGVAENRDAKPQSSTKSSYKTR